MQADVSGVAAHTAPEWSPGNLIFHTMMRFFGADVPTTSHSKYLTLRLTRGLYEKFLGSKYGPRPWSSYLNLFACLNCLIKHNIFQTHISLNILGKVA